MPDARRIAILAALLLLGAACDSKAGSSASAAPSAAEPAVASGRWVTILERTMTGRTSQPEPFHARSDSLRVITTMTSTGTSYTERLVITNLLSKSSPVPVASVRAQQRLLGQTTADTTVVEAAAGELRFFVAEHRGLSDWTVTIQEIRPAPDAADPPS